MKYKYKIDSTDMLHRFDGIEADGVLYAAEATREFAKELHAEAIPFTPKRDGPLRNTSKVTLPDVKNWNIVVEIVFDPVNKHNGYHYAQIQHEVCWFNHTTPGTKCKYLSDVMDKNANQMESEIGSRMFRHLNGKY